MSLWLLFGAVSLSAQGASFYFPYLNNASPGSNRLMPLRVVNFDSLVAMQMVIRWDPKVLKFLTIDQFTLDGLSLSDFNTIRAVDSGYVRLQWEGPTSLPPGSSVADSSSLFRMRFNLIGPDSSCSSLVVTEILDFPALNFELVKVLADTSNLAYNLDECPHTKGFICIGFTSSTEDPAASELPLSLSPNPFLVSAELNFELAEKTDAQVFITDAMGRIVFKKYFFELSPGQHGMVIENGMLGAPGLYSLTLRAGRKIVTRKFIQL